MPSTLPTTKTQNQVIVIKLHIEPGELSCRAYLVLKVYQRLVLEQLLHDSDVPFLRSQHESGTSTLQPTHEYHMNQRREIIIKLQSELSCRTYWILKVYQSLVLEQLLHNSDVPYFRSQHESSSSVLRPTYT